MSFDQAGQWGPHPVLNAEGKALPAATFEVFEEDGTTPATLYTDESKGTVETQPVNVDGLGNATFFAEPGRYVIKFTVGGSSTSFDVPAWVDPADVISETDANAAFHSVDDTDATTKTFNYLALATAAFKHRPYADPTHPDFGADPTGAASSVQAILDAISASKSVGLPPGSYYVPGGIRSTTVGVQLFALQGPPTMGGTPGSLPVELHSDQLGDVLLDIGQTTGADFRGWGIEKIGFRDSSAGNDQIAGGLRIRGFNGCSLVSLGWLSILNGFGLELADDGTVEGFNPQYTHIWDPRIQGVRYGIRALASNPDTYVYGGTVLGGEVGIDLGDSNHIFGTAVQAQTATSIIMRRGGNQLYSPRLHSPGGSTTPVGVDFKGEGSFPRGNLLIAHFVNRAEYTDIPVRIGPNCLRTEVEVHYVTGADGIATWVDDQGVDSDLRAGPDSTTRHQMFGTLAVNSAQPSVAKRSRWLVDNSAATTITDLLGGKDGQEVILKFQNANTTIEHATGAAGTRIRLAGGVNFAGNFHDTLRLVYQGVPASGSWFEISRSANS